jgi:polar amino acid transport system substrate-binding protein
VHKVQDQNAARSQLVSTGRLRAAINIANVALAKVDQQTGEVSGFSVEIARELAASLGAELHVVPYPTAGSIVEATDAGEWDVAFLAEDPSRSGKLAFSSPYALVEATYLVPAASPFRQASDLDSAGCRICVTKGAAYELFLSRNVQQAQIVHAATPSEAIEMLVQYRYDAAAGIRQSLARFAEKNDGYRVVDGAFLSIKQTVAVPKAAEHGAAFVSAFVEQAKASGLLEVLAVRSGQIGLTLAAPERDPKQPSRETAQSRTTGVSR